MPQLQRHLFRDQPSFLANLVGWFLPHSESTQSTGIWLALTPGSKCKLLPVCRNAISTSRWQPFLLLHFINLINPAIIYKVLWDGELPLCLISDHSHQRSTSSCCKRRSTVSHVLRDRVPGREDCFATEHESARESFRLQLKPQSFPTPEYAWIGISEVEETPGNIAVYPSL